MAETGAIATAARFIKLLELSEVNYISDNETMVNILNRRFRGAEHRNIKPLITDFQFQNERIQHKVFKINRSENVTAHSLATRARLPSLSLISFSCSNASCFSMSY